MKTTSAFKLLAISLVFVFIFGPAAASPGPFEFEKSLTLSGSSLFQPDWAPYDFYNLSQRSSDWDRFCTKCELKNASGTWGSVEPAVGKMSNYKPLALNPDFTKYNTISNWESSVVVANRITNNELGILDPNFEKITSKLAGYFFGAGGGAPAGGGGGCCG